MLVIQIDTISRAIPGLDLTLIDQPPNKIEMAHSRLMYRHPYDAAGRVEGREAVIRLTVTHPTGWQSKKESKRSAPSQKVQGT